MSECSELGIMTGGATSSSSSSSSTFTYDAFLSFRGKDTRYVFTGNLYSALKSRGINTFIDEAELGKGKKILSSLLTAIERSRTAIVVLSKDYATSSFCLNELVHIMECVHGQGRTVIPVFYQVTPTDVRHHRGIYGDALDAHENKFKANNKDKLNENMERLHSWKMALQKIADLSGYHFEHGDDYEYQFIANIVEQVSREIRRRALPTVDHPVGLDSHVQEVTKLLELGSDDIRMVGIHGIRGVGKTTLAVAVYNAIADSVEHLSFQLCFMGDIRENAKRYGLPHLQKIILSELFGEKGEVTSVNHGISILKPKLKGKQILLVLDNVDEDEQLEALAGESDWFGPGSRVIITTRNKKLLSRDKDKIAYKLETLNETDALELLCWKAFKTSQVDSSYMDILNEAVTYASGLPLALEVIGSNLVRKSIEQWKSALNQYKRIPNKKIQTILKVSFDVLEEFEKEIFLDIACCLKGYEPEQVKKILCAHHGVESVEYGLQVLVEKSLLKVDYCVTLHDLIQDMGREIIRQESSKKPGERSRLWLPKDIVEVFKKNMGTDKIEMIHMNSPMSGKVIKWDGDAFKNMRNLRTLIIKQAHFSREAKHLPNSLRVLTWQDYPSHSLPHGFHPEELVILDLCRSSLISVGFLRKQELESLTVLKLDLSDIEEIPDVSGAPNLKEFSFSFCENLIKVHESVGFLDKLKVLLATRCTKLSSFPAIKLTNLENLDFSFCSSLENFPEILGKMENISMTSVFGTSIKELPSSIANLSKLTSLTMSTNNNGTFHLSISSIAMFPCLEELYFEASEGLQFPKVDEGEEQGSTLISSNAKRVTLKGCNLSDECWPALVACFPNVKKLILRKNNFTVVPESIQELCFLSSLDLSDCKKLREIIGIPPNIQDLIAGECTSLNSSSKMMLLNEELHKDGDKFFRLPGSTIPEWFEHRNEGQDSISFWLRLGIKLPDLCLCLIDNQSDRLGEATFHKLIINGKNISSPKILPEGLYPFRSTNDHIAIFGLSGMMFNYFGELDELLSENWNHVVCSFLNRDTTIKQIGMHVVKHEGSMEDIRFTNPWLEEMNMGDFQINLQLTESMPSLEARQCPLPMNSWGHPPAENSLKDNGSNSIAQIGISSTTNIQGSDEDLSRYGMELLGLCWQEPLDCDNCNLSLLESTSASDIIRDEDQENTPAECSQAPPSEMASGEELHPKTCCTVLPTTSDDSIRIQIDSCQDDDIEMEKFYASLDARTHVPPSRSHDHSATAALNKEVREALKVVQDFITNNDASVFLDLEQCSVMKTSLDYLSNLSANGNLPEEVRALVSEASRVFTHCSSHYIEADMKIESSASELLRADKLEADLEDNRNQFKEVVAFEKEQLQKLARLEESKKELEKQIKAINANILVSQSKHSITRKRKSDIFEAGKTLKTEVDKLKEKVSYLQHQQDVAKETQAKLKVEWSGLGVKFRRLE